MHTDVRFKLEYALEGEGLRDDLALPRVVGPIAGGEDTSVDRNERIVEAALQTCVSVDGSEGVWVSD